MNEKKNIFITKCFGINGVQDMNDFFMHLDVYKKF